MSIRDTKAVLAGLAGRAGPLASDVAGMGWQGQVSDLPALMRPSPQLPLALATGAA